jgi:hypothetical protein
MLGWRARRHQPADRLAWRCSRDFIIAAHPVTRFNIDRAARVVRQ